MTLTDTLRGDVRRFCELLEIDIACNMRSVRHSEGIWSRSCRGKGSAHSALFSWGSVAVFEVIKQRGKKYPEKFFNMSVIWCHSRWCTQVCINPLKPELNPICYLLALLGIHHFLHVSRIRVKLLTFRLLMSYIYGAPILDVSRSHTTTQHSR